MSLKSRLIENIVSPVATDKSTSSIDAKVTKVNERSNTCSIKYINNEGIPVEQANVPVQLHNIGIIDWFPKLNEHVLITTKGKGDITITGPSYGRNYNNIRYLTKLTEDIYSDISSATMGGYIF